MPIRVERAQGLGALQLVVTYDATLLEDGQAEAGAVFAGLVEFHVGPPGRLRVALVTSEPVRQDGELIRLKFGTRGPGPVQIGLEAVRAWEQESGHEMAVNASGGVLTIEAAQDAPGIPVWLVGAGVVLLLAGALVARRRRR